MASANNLGTAYIRIAPQMQGIQSTIQRSLGGLGSSVGAQFSSGFTSKLGRTAGVIAGVTSAVATKALGAITNSLDDAIKRVDTLNAFPKIMKNLGFETEESNATLEKLTVRIEGLPTTLDEIVTYTQRLASTTGNLNKGMYNATNLAIAFNDAALAGGKGQYEANRAFEQFVQVVSRGRPSMQDWKIMMEVMPGQLKQVAKYMGTNNKSLQEYAKNAKKTVGELDGLDLYNWISEDKNEHAKARLNDMQKALIDLDNKGGAGITAFKDQVGDATHTIGNALRLVQVRITKAMAKIIQSFGAGGIYDAIDGFTSSFNKVADVIVEKVVPPLKSTLEPMLSALVPVIKNVASGVLSLVKTIAQSQGMQVFIKSLQTILPKIINLLGAVISVLLQIASVVVVVWDAIWTNLLQPIYEKVEPIVSWVFGALTTVLSSLANMIQTNLGNIKAFISGFFAGIKAIASSTKAFFVNIVKSIISVFASIIGPLRSAFQAAVNTIKSVFSPVTNFFKSVFNAIKTTFSKVYEIGRDIIKGLWNGIKDMAGWVKDKIKNFSEDVLNGIKEFFGIHSPSTVMAEQGKYIAQGLAEGITDNAKYATKAMDKMAEDMLRESAKIDTNIGSAFGNTSPLASGLSSANTYGQNQVAAPAQVIQNNTFNQVANNLDVKEASRLLGWQVATTI